MPTPINKDKFKELYKQVTSIGGFKYTEDELMNDMQQDSSVAKKLYNYANDRINVKLLDAADEEHFLEMIYNNPASKQQKEVMSQNDNTLKQLGDLDIPGAQYKAPDVELKRKEEKGPLSFTQQRPNMSQYLFGTDSVLDYETSQQRIAKEIDELGKDEIKDVDRIDTIASDLEKEYEAFVKKTENFIRDYENHLRDAKINSVNMHHDSYELVNPWTYKKRKESSDYINNNQQKYREITQKRRAYNRQLEMLKTYRQLAVVDKSIASGEVLSSMVTDGDISESAMKVLRTSDAEQQKKYISEMVGKGVFDKSTADKILALGDTRDYTGMLQGLFKTGMVEDIATIGANEIMRNFEVNDIISRIKNGIEVSDEEKNAVSLFVKLQQMQDEAHSDRRGFWFNFGQGTQKTLLFMAEMLLTGGVSGSGKTFGAKGAKALIEKYGFKNAKNMILKKAVQSAGGSAAKQMVLTPITPSAYVDFSNRVIGLNLQESNNLSTKDYAKNMYLSYASTFAERYSEALFNVISDVPMRTLITKGKATKELSSVFLKNMARLSENQGFKKTTELLGAAGIQPDILNEIGGEVTSVLMDYTLSGFDKEKLQELDKEFFYQVALQSVILQGIGGISKYTIGGISSSIENSLTKSQYNQSLDRLNNASFSTDILNSLKNELVNAMDKGNFVQDAAKNNERSVDTILAEMRNEMKNSSDSKNDRRIMSLVDSTVRYGALRYGQILGIKDYVQSKVGEFENENGNVYEFTDLQGNNYFILDSTENSVAVYNRTTGGKEVKDKGFFDQGKIVETNSSDWAVTTFLMNIDSWNLQDQQIQQTQPQQPDNNTPASKLSVNGQIVPVEGYDANTGKYTISDPASGEKVEVEINGADIVPIYSNEMEGGEVQTETEDVESDSNEDVNTDEEMDSVGEDILQYDENEEPIWLSASVERGKQEIDAEFEGEDATNFVADKVKEAEEGVKKANKLKAKSTKFKERKAENQKIKAEKESAQKALDYWNQMKALYENQTKDEAPQQQDTPKVVDDSRDTPADARARGFKMVNGVRYDRQTGLETAKYGNETEVKFADKLFAKGKIAVVEADEAQPSHIGGQENPLHFTPEMQPKARVDKVSVKREDDIARNMKPQEITGGTTAYTGNPSLNQVGEAIQGNSRLAALKRMYEQYPEKADEYKQYLIDHASEWGLNPEEIASMKAPVLVNVLDVTDQQAIELGQRTAQDIESGGKQSISPQNVAQQLDKDMKTLAGILLRTDDEDAALDDVVNANGYEALKWLTQKKVITETQMQTALDEKGNITPEARQALKDILSQIIFKGGNKNIRAQFAKLPKAAQKALLQTISRELDSAEGDGILKDIQEAIEVYSNLLNDKDFVEAKGKDAVQNAVGLWAKQMQMDFTEGNFVPEDRYSNFAIAFAVSFRTNTMKEQSAKLNQLYDYLQQEGGDIFNPAVKLSKEEAVKEVYGVELNKKKQDETNEQSGDSISVDANQESTDGRPRSTEGTTDAGRGEQNLGQTDSEGTVGDSQTAVSEQPEQVEEQDNTEEDNAPQQVEITSELIDSLPIDDVMKSYAKQYLNGKVNKLTTLAYQAVEDYVQNESRNGARDSANANGTQLGSTVDDEVSDAMGDSSRRGGSVDRGQSDGDVSTERPSGENSEGGLFSVSGEESDSGVEQPTSDESGDRATGRRNSRRSGGKRGNVRKSSRPTGSDGVSTDAGQQGDRAQSIDDKIKSADELADEALAEIENILKDSVGKIGAMGNPDMFKLIPPVAKLGYALTKKGFYTFAKWFSQMQEKIGPLLRNHFTIEEIDELIRDMWDTEFPYNGESHTVAEWASIVEQEELRKMVRMSLEEKVALQKSRENVKVVLEDLDNIRESLPFLLPQQQEDVLKAETQFFSETHKQKKYGNGKGILFTNGTGTGKTYTGLGIVKRFVKQGKGRILIVTAQDKKIKDWIRDASNLGIEATQLKDTKDKGKGVVVTQFANMYQNRALLEDEWDLIVYDESHKLMENQDGTMTSRAVMHHLLSNRDIEQAVRRQLRDHELFKKELDLMTEKDQLADLLKVKSIKDLKPEQKALYEKYDSDKDAIERRYQNIDDEINELKAKQIALIKETLNNEEAVKKAQASVDNTKVVFLSATPFNTAKNLDYVESYIFSYNPEDTSNGDGKYLPSELRDKDRNNFVLEKFPSSHYKLGNGEVRMRSEAQIANPEKSSQEETDFSDELQKLGTMSGRTLDSEWDYSRQFPKLNFEQAQMFNIMYAALKRGKYAPLLKYFKVLEDYDKYTEYFEAIKTALSLDRIKQHVELGRKVVVFHRRRSNTTRGGLVGTPIYDVVSGAVIDDGRERSLMEEFEKEFAEYLAWERNANLDFANYAITEAFATAEEKAQYQEDLKKWEQKVREANAKGKKGPDRPTIKTKTVAVFNGSVSETDKRAAADSFNDNDSDVKVIVVQVASGKEGVDLHDKTGKFQRAEVNLYLPESPIEFIQAEGRIYRIGNKSNAVFEYPLLGVDLELASFAMKINGRAQTSENLALGSKSRGLRNSIARAALSSRGMDVSSSQGVGGKDMDSKSEQIKEDFDTAIQNYNEWKDNQADTYEDKQVPDPIGERMSTWAMSEPGDNVLVPFAAEGSVARYVSPSSRLIAYEGRTDRFARLAMLCGGSGRKVVNEEYLGEERQYSDSILFFKPMSAPGLESQNVMFALNRLADSGRMVILTTDGKNLREKLSRQYRYENNIIVRASVKLPSSIIGTDKNNLELIVIDNLYNEELQKQAKADTLDMDLSDITDETKLWEALRGVQIPARIIDNIAKTRKRAEKCLAFIAECPTVKKKTEYSSTGKNKLVPNIYKSNSGCSFSLKRQGYVSIRYDYFTKGHPNYSPRTVESWAESWVNLQQYIKEYENNEDKRVIERVQEYRALCNFIESLLDKTPPQIKNIAMGISENVVTGQIDVPTLKDTVKGMLGGNAALERLNDRVMKVAESFGLQVEIVSERHSKFSGKNRSVQGFYSLNDNKIWIKEEFINSIRYSDEKKAEVLLHEAIHAVTSHALGAYQNGLINENSPLYKACADIAEVYEAIKDDPYFTSLIKGKDGIDAANNEYGLTDVHEMMAELANPAFRAALKAKKLWRQVINGIKRILGIQMPGIESEQTDALNVLENALEVLLDNLDVNTFNRYKGAGLFSKMEFNYEGKNQTNDALKLSNLTDNKGNKFYEKNGTINLWDISKLLQKAKRQIAPVRLTDRNVNHILESHNKEFKNNIQNILSFIDDVFNNAEVIHRARAGAMYVVVENTKTDKAAIIKLYPSEYGDYYNVETAGYYRKSMLDKKDEIARLSEPELSDSATDASKPQRPQINGEEALNTKAAITSFNKGSNNFDNTTANTQNSSKLYRQSSTPLEARQHSEEVMREKIDDMANVFGVTPEYIYDEKNTQNKGWYEPATGKVVVNLSAHGTIEDARKTYLHEVVGHFGLRGLLKDKFEQVMEQVFNSLPKEVQDEYLSKYGSKHIAAEEYLSQMAEMDVEPTLVNKIAGVIRDVLRAIGINVGRFSDGDMLYLLWRSKNNLKSNPGLIEAARWGAKDLEIRRRASVYGRPIGYQTNQKEMTWLDRQLYKIQDRMRPVKVLTDEIIDRGGSVEESSDVYNQETLSAGIAPEEIKYFKLNRLEPMTDAFINAMRVFTEQMGMISKDAKNAVYDYLYAKHAPERNKKICIDELIAAANRAIKPDKANLINDNFNAELERITEQIYDNIFQGGKNQINPQNVTAEQAKLLVVLAGVVQKEAQGIASYYTKDANGNRIYIGNNRSGMNDLEAQAIMDKLYTPETQAALEELSDKVRECTNFTLDKWLQYELISKEEYDTYKAQYQYYIPLRGWEEKGDETDYSEVPKKQMNSTGIINLNRQAKGRWSKADNPIAYIQSLAHSACVTGNRNLIKRKAFNLILENQGIGINDLAVFEHWYEVKDEDGNVVDYTPIRPEQLLFDKGRVKVVVDKDYEYHKTKQQHNMHVVSVVINGANHNIIFKGTLGAQAAASINGDKNEIRSQILKGVAPITRWISANLTARNIFFIFRNLWRDLGFGNFAYFIENGFHKTLQLNGYYLSAMKTAAFDASRKDPSKLSPKQKADYDLYQEFKMNGGQTGYIQLYEMDKLAKSFDKIIDKASANRGIIEQGAVDTANLIVDTFDILGKASENAMRFAVYKTERQNGASPREAAIRAKEITVNFNRQGKNTTALSALFAFFNPAIQGTYRYISLAVKHPVRFIKTTAALMTIKLAFGIICELFSGDDEEEESSYDRLSDYVKATNWVIPLPWTGENNEGKFVCIPIPQSVRASTYLSDCMVDIMFGKKTISEALTDFALFSAGEFIPFDIDAIDLKGKPTETVFQAFMPTVLKPFYEVAINRDFMGNPISKEPYVIADEMIPQHQLAFGDTSPILVGTSKFLNNIAGGDEFRSAKFQISENGQVEESGLGSFMDINPSKIEHIFSGYFGGMFDIVMDTWDIMTSVADKDRDIQMNSIPFVNQIVKGPTSKPGYKKFFQMRDEAENIMRAVRIHEKNYDEEYKRMISNRYNHEITNTYMTYSSLIKDLNSNIAMLKSYKDKQNNESIKELEKQRDELIKQAANSYRNICRRRDEDN